eukprot:92958_1
MTMLINTVNGQQIQYDKETIQQVGVALNALIQKRMKNKEGTYVDQMFKEICNATGYGELDVKDILSSDVMKFVLCNKNGSMRLDVLSNIFTNIKRWRIDLSGVDADAQNNVIFNDKLIHFVAKKQVQSVRFLNVLESIVTDIVSRRIKRNWLQLDGNWILLCLIMYYGNLRFSIDIAIDVI